MPKNVFISKEVFIFLKKANVGHSLGSLSQIKPVGKQPKRREKEAYT